MRAAEGRLQVSGADSQLAAGWCLASPKAKRFGVLGTRSVANLTNSRNLDRRPRKQVEEDALCDIGVMASDHLKMNEQAEVTTLYPQCENRNLEQVIDPFFIAVDDSNLTNSRNLKA